MSGLGKWREFSSLDKARLSAALGSSDAKLWLAIANIPVAGARLACSSIGDLFLFLGQYRFMGAGLRDNHECR